MIEKWTMAPWMRRRLARHARRGTSDRVIACLINPAPTAMYREVLPEEALPCEVLPCEVLSADSLPADVRPADAVGHPSARYDLSNVILFRALAVQRAGGRDAR